MLRRRPEIKETIGKITTGGGASASSYMAVIIGGNTLPYGGGVGVKKIITEVTVIPTGYSSGTPSTTMDGICWARSNDNGAYILVANDSLSFIAHDILLNTPIKITQAYKISDSGTGSYTVYRVSGLV